MKSPPSLPRSRIAERKCARDVASRTVFSASTRSTSRRAPDMSGDREHLDVAQGRHRVGNEIAFADARRGPQRPAQLVGAHLFLKIHRRAEPVLRDRIEARLLREAPGLRGSDRLERVERLLGIELVARIDLAAEVLHLAPVVAFAVLLAEAAREFGELALQRLKAEYLEEREPRSLLAGMALDREVQEL